MTILAIRTHISLLAYADAVQNLGRKATGPWENAPVYWGMESLMVKRKHS
jgi:hypothetical protein